MNHKFGATHFRSVKIADAKHTIVFLNSLGSDFRIWEKVLAAGIGENSSILMDMRGHGLSDLGVPPYSIAELSLDVKELLEHLGVHKVVLCGVSVGGLVAQQFVSSWPEWVEGMVLSNTADKIGDEQSWQNRIDLVDADGLAPIADQILANWFSPQFRTQSSAEYKLYANMLTRTSREGYSGICHALKNTDLRAQSGEIDVPTTCIAGGADQATPAELVQSFSHRIAGAKYEFLDAVGHLPSIEAPERIAQIIRELLATIEGKQNG